MHETAAEARTSWKSRAARRTTLTRRSSWVGLGAASMPLFVLIVLPLVALVLRVTPADLFAAFAEPAVSQALQVSAVTTLLTTGLTLLLGTPMAFLLARRQFPGRAVLETVLELPMVLPPAVAGIALLVAFGRRGLLGPWLDVVGISIPFTPAAVVIAQFFVASPFYVKAAIGAFSAVEREVEQAAMVDGAGPLAVFRHITLPLAVIPLVGGAVMTWARALGEFGATIIFAGNFQGRTQTMTLAIYLGFELDLRVSLTLAILLLTSSTVVLLLVKGILRQRIAAGIQ